MKIYTFVMETLLVMDGGDTSWLWTRHYLKARSLEAAKNKANKYARSYGSEFCETYRPIKWDEYMKAWTKDGLYWRLQEDSVIETNYIYLLNGRIKL